MSGHTRWPVFARGGVRATYAAERDERTEGHTAGERASDSTGNGSSPGNRGSLPSGPFAETWHEAAHVAHTPLISRTAGTGPESEHEPAQAPSRRVVA